MSSRQTVIKRADKIRAVLIASREIEIRGEYVIVGGDTNRACCHKSAVGSRIVQAERDIVRPVGQGRSVWSGESPLKIYTNGASEPQHEVRMESALSYFVLLWLREGKIIDLAINI